MAQGGHEYGPDANQPDRCDLCVTSAIVKDAGLEPYAIQHAAQNRTCADKLQFGETVLADKQHVENQQQDHKTGCRQARVKHAYEPASLEQDKVQDIAQGVVADHTLRMFSRLLPGLANRIWETPMARSLNPASQ